MDSVPDWCAEDRARRQGVRIIPADRAGLPEQERPYFPNFRFNRFTTTAGTRLEMSPP
jgi:hypothetical protein